MPYLVFDCRKASGYLFETRFKWLAHAFCVIASRLGHTCFDYEAAMDFTPYTTPEAAQWEADYRG